MKPIQALWPLGLLVLAVVFASAGAQTGRAPAGGEQDLRAAIEELRSTVEKLNDRVDRLEARAALASPGYLDEEDGGKGAARPAGGPPDNVMELDGIEGIEADPAQAEELEELRDEVEAIERTVDSHKQRVASQAGHTGGYRSGSYGTKNVGAGRERRATGELLADYQDQLRKKQGDVKRLERELAEPKQIILGNWKGKVITLRTTRDLSRSLDKVELGGYLTWEGRRASASAEAEEWVVTSISPVDASDVR